MKAMLAALVAIIVISIGAGYALNEFGSRSGVVAENVRAPERG